MTLGAAETRLQGMGTTLVLAVTITRAIGMPGDVQPDVRQITLAHGDRLLLCSDGLTKMLADERVEAILGGGDPGTACRALVDAANEAGGDDNVSVVAVDVSGSRL